MQYCGAGAHELIGKPAYGVCNVSRKENINSDTIRDNVSGIIFF